MTSEKIFRIGVIGTGGMGTRHAVNLHRRAPGARVTAVYDFDAGRAQQAADQCPGAAVFRDPNELVASNTVDAVLIASPDPTHVEYTLACLEQSKPVLCEKPLATSPQDAMRILEKEMALGQRLVSVGFMRRFDPQHCAVQSLVASEKLGRPVVYKGVHRNAEVPSGVSGAMVITNSASHDFDAARWLLGQEVEEVFVRGVRSHGSFSQDTTDLLLMQLTFGASCLAAIEVFVAAEYGYEVSVEMVCERGTATTTQPELALVRQNLTRGAAVAYEWLERFNDAYIEETRVWVDSLVHGTIFPGASAWDGYAALRVADACIRSLESGLPVKVNLEEEPAFYRQA